MATAATPATSGAAAETPVIFRKSRRDKPELDEEEDCLDLRFFFFSGRSSTEWPPRSQLKRLEILTPVSGKNQWAGTSKSPECLLVFNSRSLALIRGPIL